MHLGEAQLRGGLTTTTLTATATVTLTATATTLTPTAVTAAHALPGLRRGCVWCQPELRSRGVLHGGLLRLPLPQAAARLERRPPRWLLGLRLEGRVRWRQFWGPARPACDEGDEGRRVQAI